MRCYVCGKLTKIKCHCCGKPICTGCGIPAAISHAGLLDLEEFWRELNRLYAVERPQR